MSSRSHGKTNFQMSWLKDNCLKSWLKPGKPPSQAICTLCNSALVSVEKIGVSALSSHAKGKKHKKKSSSLPFHVYFFNQVVASLNKKKVIHQLVVLVLQ